MTVIQGELLNDDEDIGKIEKMIFSLKDPLSATKISLPVKSTICIHFECFDFDNFCKFSHIPEGIKYVCRKDLVKKNFEKKKSEKREQEMLEKLRRKGDLKTQESELWKKQFYEVSEKLKHQRKGTKLYKSLDSELQLIMNRWLCLTIRPISTRFLHLRDPRRVNLHNQIIRLIDVLYVIGCFH